MAFLQNANKLHEIRLLRKLEFFHESAAPGIFFFAFHGIEDHFEMPSAETVWTFQLF